MTTEDDFQRALDLEPGAHHLRLIFADWLDEHDDPRAAGYRALARGCHHPRMPTEGGDYCPWYGSEEAFAAMCNPWGLPKDWFALIEIRGKTRLFAPDHDYVIDATRRELEDAAALAFSLLPSARQAALLAVPALTS